MGGITFDADRLREIGERYGIARLEVFGSVGRGGEHGESDLDLLVRRSFTKLGCSMRRELLLLREMIAA